MNLLDRRKPLAAILADARDRDSGMKRTLGVVGLTAIGIATTIGAGIFVITGHAAAENAGPAIMLSFVLAGFVCGCSALCYAELASTVPISGSAYTYTYATLGELLAWIIGWDLILEYAVGAATVSIGWGSYVNDFVASVFGHGLPAAFAAAPGAGGIVNVPAILVILAITALLIRGTQETSATNTVIVGLKLVIVVFFIAVGAIHVNAQNWHPFFPFGPLGVLSGAGTIFFAYIGFDAVSTSAEEAVEPQRDLPRGIIASLAICTVLYIVVAAVLTGMLPFGRLDVASPVSFALLQAHLNWAAAIVSVGAIAGLTTVLIGLLYGQSRVFYAMSRDGLLPGLFTKLHPTRKTPWRSNLIVGFAVAAIAGLTPIDTVAKMTNIGTLAAFFLVSIGVVILRRREPNADRGFRVPFSPAIPYLSAAGSLLLIVTLPWLTIVRFVVWLAIGLVVYFAYGRKRSRLA